MAKEVLEEFMQLDAIAQALGNLALGNKGKLSVFVGDIERSGKIDNTQFVSHCHFVELEPNGLAGIDRLIDYIVQCVTSYAIPNSEIAKARKHVEETGSLQELNKLYDQAKGLFTTIKNSGEGGELLLYLLANEFLNLPQLICKMDLKTSTQMHYHGVDGVHVGVTDDKKKLCLYWGESKIHGDAGTAINECLDSIAPYLLQPMSLGSVQQREFQHILRRMDYDDKNLEETLKKLLDPDGEHFKKLEIRALGLVGFDEESYPKAAKEKESPKLQEEISGKLPAWKEKLSKKAKGVGIDKFILHIFCVPFPSVQNFRDRLIARLGV